MKEVFIVSAVRTPIGSFGGKLATFTATELGAMAMKGALAKANLEASAIEEVYFGNVCSANLGQAPARQAALKAGLSVNTPCTTVNKVCASGTKTIMLAAMAIATGQAEVLMAGGMESMSQVPYYMPKARWGYKYGHAELIDGLAKDGLEDAYDKKAMGVYADQTAAHYQITREQQDEFAINSYKKAAAATDAGKFSDEIIPVEIAQKKGPALFIDKDEQYTNVFFDKIPSLRPAFTPDGTVTAANASTINDGASALILASAEAIKKYNLTPIARVVSFADAEQEPKWFTTSPAEAFPKALKKSGLSKNDISYYEINEAFAVVSLAFAKIVDIDPATMNVNGGAVALGHPLGASGARIATTLCHVLKQNNGKYGALSICNGGGGASSIILESV